ncbi:hypothetical protein B566_EDAN007077 [Ephemera danica]|nr:hypothetical protein B566_EDAN007077 [Ephemera danica]
MVPLLLTLLVLATAVQAQMYDMKDGNDEGLISPCIGGPVGRWDNEEPASLYPGGPTDGFVLTSSNSSTSCLDTPTSVHLTRQSKLYLAIRVNPQTGSDIFKLWVIRLDDRSSSYTVSLRYFQITENDYVTTSFPSLN